MGRNLDPCSEYWTQNNPLIDSIKEIHSYMLTHIKQIYSMFNCMASKINSLLYMICDLISENRPN